MNVLMFIDKFRGELERPVSNEDWNYENFLEWNADFFERTSQFHKSAKDSFFDISNEYIRERKIIELRDFIPFLEFYIFREEDEPAFLRLIQNTSSLLSEVNDKRILDDLLDYLNYMLDYLFHEPLFKMDSTLRYEWYQVLDQLTKSIMGVRHYDPEGWNMVERFIWLHQPPGWYNPWFRYAQLRQSSGFQKPERSQ